MSSEFAPLTVDDIEEDLAAIAAWQDRAKDVSSPPGANHRVRGTFRSGESSHSPALSGVGRQLIRNCGLHAEKRLDTLLHLELNLRPNDDFGLLIGWASQLSESVLVDLVAEKLRPYAGRLAEILAGIKDYRGAARVLEMWGTGQQQPTLGTLVNILFALRKAETLPDTKIHAVASGLFTERFLELLRGTDLAQSLRVMRDRFRNPAAHGIKTFSSYEYEEFSRLTVAQPRFLAWEQRGPDPAEPPANQAVLHHHLAGYRWPGVQTPNPEPSPLDRLWSLSSPPESELSIEIVVERLHAGTNRDIGLMTVSEAQVFRLGTELSVELSSQQSVYGLLIDIGTGGMVAVLWPNQWYPDGRIQAGVPASVPGPRCPHRLTLQGATGCERLIALAASDPWPSEWGPLGSDAFRELDLADIERLLARIAAQDRRSWAVAKTMFEIVN